MNGKGDKNRTSDIKRYKNNYERIFGSKPVTTATRPRQDVPRNKVGRGTKRRKQRL